MGVHGQEQCLSRWYMPKWVILSNFHLLLKLSHPLPGAVESSESRWPWAVLDFTRYLQIVSMLLLILLFIIFPFAEPKWVGELFHNNSTTERGLIDARSFGGLPGDIAAKIWEWDLHLEKTEMVLWVQSKRSRANSSLGWPQACGSYISPWETRPPLSVCLSCPLGDTKARAKHFSTHCD